MPAGWGVPGGLSALGTDDVELPLPVEDEDLEAPLAEEEDEPGSTFAEEPAPSPSVVADEPESPESSFAVDVESFEILEDCGLALAVFGDVTELSSDGVFEDFSAPSED